MSGANELFLAIGQLEENQLLESELAIHGPSEFEEDSIMKDGTKRKNLHNGAYRENPDAISYRKRPRLLLIAAIVALMILLMGCAWAVFHMEDLKIAQESFWDNPRYLADGTKLPAAEKSVQVLSVQGIAGSKTYQAAKDWYESRNALGDSVSTDSKEYMDLMETVCARYGLKPAGKAVLVLEQAQEVIPEWLGFSDILKADAPADIRYCGGRFYECGNFNLDYYITLAKEIWEPEFRINYNYANKAYLDTLFAQVREPESAEQWNYTTKDNFFLLIVKTGEEVYLFCDREDAFLTVSFCSYEEHWDGTKTEMSREVIQNIAECVDFGIVTSETPDVTELNQKLDARYRSEPEIDPAESERRRQEYEAHEIHSSFRDVIIDVRDNEEYFTKYCNRAYENFWETMEYCFLDINGDGQEELLLGRDGASQESWMMQDGVIRRSISGYTHGYPCEGNYFEGEESLDGGQYHCYLQMEKTGGYTMVESLSYSPADGIWWHGQPGEEREAVTEAQAMEIMASYRRIELQMQSVREFPLEE